MQFTAMAEHSAAPPIPSDAALFSNINATDIGVNARTYTVVSRGGVDSMIEFYRQHYERDGWTSASYDDLGSSSIAVMRKGGERAEVVVTLSDDGSSFTIINLVDYHCQTSSAIRGRCT